MKCVICNLEKSDVTYVFWGKDFKDYTSNFGSCGYYKANDLINKCLYFPTVTTKKELREALKAHTENVIIPIKDIYNVLGLPKEVFLK